MVVGILAAALGFYQRDTLVEAVIVSAVLGLLLWLALRNSPLPELPTRVALAAGLGLITGLLSGAVYAEFFATRTFELAQEERAEAHRRENQARPSATTASDKPTPDAATTEEAAPAEVDAAAPVDDAPPAEVVEPPEPVHGIGAEAHRPRPGPDVFIDFTTVRIKKLMEADRDFVDGVDELTRPPRVGDEGTVLESDEHEGTRVYWVECMTDADDTIWVAQFLHEELESVEEEERGRWSLRRRGAG